MRSMLALAIAGALAGCRMPTSFTGSAKVKNGPAGCKATCDGWGMDLAGMVKMGDYSDGCICQTRSLVAPNPVEPGAAQPLPEPQTPGPSSSAPPTTRAAPYPAVSGVWLQMQAAAAAAAAAQHRSLTGLTDGSHPCIPHSPPGSPGWCPGLP